MSLDKMIAVNLKEQMISFILLFQPVSCVFSFIRLLFYLHF